MPIEARRCTQNFLLLLQNPLQVAHRVDDYRVRETVPRVRILLSPPHSLKCREIRFRSSRNRCKMPQFRNDCVRSGPEIMARSKVTGELFRLFLWRADEQSGFNDSIRRMQCDHKPTISFRQMRCDSDWFPITAQPHGCGQEERGDGHADPQTRAAHETTRHDMCHWVGWKHLW
jgi:hypothetical protein